LLIEVVIVILLVQVVKRLVIFQGGKKRKGLRSGWFILIYCILITECEGTVRLYVAECLGSQVWPGDCEAVNPGGISQSEYQGGVHRRHIPPGRTGLLGKYLFPAEYIDTCTYPPGIHAASFQNNLKKVITAEAFRIVPVNMRIIIDIADNKVHISVVIQVGIGGSVGKGRTVKSPRFSHILKGELSLISEHVIAKHGSRDHILDFHQLHGRLSCTPF